MQNNLGKNIYIHILLLSRVWLFETHGLQHTRVPCPLLSPRVCSDLCPLNWWYYLTISSSAAYFSFCFQSFQYQGFFQWVSSSHQVTKVWSFSSNINPSNEYSRLISFRIDWLDLLADQGTLKNPLQHHSSKASFIQCSLFLMVQLSHPYMNPGKTIALNIQTIFGKVMSLLFNMLSSLVIAFSSRSKCFLISWLQSLFTVIWEPKKIKSVTVFTFFPFIYMKCWDWLP